MILIILSADLAATVINVVQEAKNQKFKRKQNIYWEK